MGDEYHMIAKNPNKVCILARQTRYAKCICVVQHIPWDIRQMTLLCNVVLYYQIGRCKKHRESLVDVPTNPPLYCKEEEIEGFGHQPTLVLKRGSSNFVKVLKSQLYIFILALGLNIGMKKERKN